MDKERDSEQNNLVDKEEHLPKVTNNEESAATQEKLQMLRFVRKTEPTELPEETFSGQLVAENQVPEIGNEISIKTENETHVPSEEARQNVPLGAEQVNSFNDILLAEGNNHEIELEGKISLLAASTNIADALATFSEPEISRHDETDGGESKKRYSWKTLTRSANPGKINCHNLSVSELRRKLSVCPVCQFQYCNYKLATVCLTKHGKRQCWLCLEVLSTKRQDYYRHCVEHHFVSNMGENVGCPFCPKYFDFRQGLNQHIVKIHFAENISDFNAVASLSPKTLVDIFTGQPRETSLISSSILTPSESRESTCEEDTIPDELPLAVRSIFENAFKALDCSGGGLPLPSSSVEISSAIIPPPPAPLNDGVVCNRQAFPNLNKIVMLGSSNSNPRSSVITLPSRNPVQRMTVPPEQTMSSLAEEIAIREVGSLLSSIPFDNSHQYFQQRYLSGPNPYSGQNSIEHEHSVEIVDNNSLKFHPEASSFNYEFGRNPLTPIILFPPVTQMSRVTSDPEKYEMSLHPNFSQKSKLQEEALPTLTPSEGHANGLRSSYEKDIIRENSDTLENKFEDNNGLSTLRSMGSRPNNEGENVLSCFSEAEKSYLDSITRMLETSPDLGFNSGMTEEKEKSNGSPPENTVESLPVQSSTGAGDITDNSNLTEGSTLNPEIRESPASESLKSLNNCGVKRRILMKAMWDEQNQQFKKPAFPDTHALVHDLHASTYYLTQPVSSSQKVSTTSNPHSNPQKVVALKRGYNEVCFGIKARDEPEPPKQESIVVSQGEMMKNAGPFFQQYVKQEKVRPREDHYKLFNPASTIHSQESGDLSSKHTTISVATGWTTTGGGCMRLDPTRPRGNAPRPRPLGPYQAPTHSSSTFTRPQFPTPHQVHVRRPPNTAFWDNLRARLMEQNSQRMKESCSFSRSNGQPMRSSCALELPKLENVTVKNPFEEEAISLKKSRQVSPIPSLFDLRLGQDMNRFQTAGSNKNINPLGIGNYQAELPLQVGKESFIQHQHQRCCQPLPRAHPLCPAMISHPCCNLMMGQFEFPCNALMFQPPYPPPIPLTIYRAQLQHREMMEQCARLSHGMVRNINPQSCNRYRGEFRHGFHRF